MEMRVMDGNTQIVNGQKQGVDMFVFKYRNQFLSFVNNFFFFFSFGTPKFMKQVMQGVPPSIRAECWPRAIGNALQINPDLYR